MSELCLGTMTFGAEADEQVSHRLLDRFVEVGGNLPPYVISPWTGG